MNERGYDWCAPDRYKILRAFQIKNRQYPTEAEKIFWDTYRREVKDIRLRRQYIISDYIVDFVCLQSHLIIKLDGGYHSEAEQVYEDRQRENALKRLGFSILRFKNEDIFNDIQGVFTVIRKKINEQI